MSEELPRRDREVGEKAADEIAAGARPSVNQPLNADPRPRVAPAVVVIAILVAVLVVILALTLL
jgi:hypothetical protein